MHRRISIALSLAAALLQAGTAQARTGTTTCTMAYSLSGWSAFYKSASGSGEIRCSNGQRMSVKLSAKGGGLTLGKYRSSGSGEFAGVRDIKDVLGTYASASADAAAGKAASAQAMTKGDVSLALSGKGEGWNLGVAFTGFTISH